MIQRICLAFSMILTGVSLLQGAEVSIADRLKAAGLAEEEVRPFLAAIQNTVARNDLKALAQMIRFPIRLNRPPVRSATIRNARDFMAHYPRFITDNWRKAVLRQKYEDLFVNWQGVMIGRGEIWFSRVCKDKSCWRSELKIIAINL